MGKVVRLETNTIANYETGEITNQTTASTFVIGTEPDFVKVYLDNIMFLSEVQGWVGKVLYKLLNGVSYADKGQIIIINPAYKRMLAEELQMKPQSVTNAINKLVEKDILIKKDSGLFLLNPQYFGKGQWKDIAKIRYEVELSGRGKVIRLLETEGIDGE